MPTIAVADIDELGGAETARLIEKAGGSAISLHVDVSRRADCDAMVAATVTEFGRLDVLYNNAAVQMSGRLVDCTEDEWDLTIATNLNAIFWACRAALPHMLDGAAGRSSTPRRRSASSGPRATPRTARRKAGLVALDPPDRSRVRPPGPRQRDRAGSIDTPRFRRVTDQLDDPDAFLEMLTSHLPLRRVGTADEVAAIALFLASDASAYTSGAVIPCDGGLAALR